MKKEKLLQEQNGITYMVGGNEILASHIHSLELKNIYIDSFPPSERVDFSELVTGILQTERLLFTARRNKQVVGFATVFPLPKSHFYMIEYLAIDKEFRNWGIGGRLLQTMSNTLKTNKNISGLILEVDSDEDGSEAEKKLRKRRIEFYRRNGAYIVDCAPFYCIPDFENEGNRLILKLMWIPLNATSNTLSGYELRDSIISIYRYSYERTSANDLLLQSILDALIC